MPLLIAVHLCDRFEDSSFSRFSDMKEDQNVNIGMIWEWLGHSRSSAMSPFDRAHTTSYSHYVETMRLSCTVFEI